MDCSESTWRLLATHSFRLFPLHFSRASPCVTRFRFHSTYSDNGALNINIIVALLLSWRRNTPYPAQLTESLGSLSCHKIPPQISVRRLNPVYNLWPHTIEIHFNIILQSVVSSGPFPSYFHTKFPYAFLSHSCLSTSPSNPSIISQVWDDIVGRAEFCWYFDPLGFYTVY